MTKIGIVCDSTCDLGPEWLADHDIAMVPLKVTFGTETFLDWTELTPAAFYEKLAAADMLPKTSQPSPADFGAVYGRLADEGCTGIVSIHLTSALSGTIESAIMAANESPVPVRIVDTRVVSAATALVVDAALVAREGGADLDGVEAAAQAAADNVRILFALDTLDYLVKGGRAGKAQGLAASLLNIKPVLTFNSDGIIEPFKKAKGMKKAIAEIAAQVAEASADGPVKLGLLHAQAPDLIAELRAALDVAGARYELLHTVGVGAVIGTYAGPRAIGAAFYRLP
ncbi:MAG: DegV family protein [Coriobacteriia bacterium]|nr:DegV family protein [Actinomycetota bacterium]MDZ4166433.1 DegV family protein [Coriobacteriia bacterium]